MAQAREEQWFFIVLLGRAKEECILNFLLNCAGKGAASRKTPEEIMRTPFTLATAELERMVYSSKMTAKADNNLLQDNYQLYHHNFVISESGRWAVVQQGMNEHNKYARRYHWLSETAEDFVEEPRSGIIGPLEGEQGVLNLTAEESRETRTVSLDLVNDNPAYLLRERDNMLATHHHEPIPECDLSERSILQLTKAYELQPENYEELAALKGIGAKSLWALALIS